MNYNYAGTPLSKSLLAGLATGIIATIINLIYNFVYRGITRLSLSFSVISVPTIIFAIVLLCTVAGLVYYSIVYYFKKSPKLYTAVFIGIIILAVLLGLNYHRSTDIVISHQFEGLYLEILAITALFGVFFIPWLVKHKNVFFD